MTGTRTIACIGLGIMGSPMAVNLAEAGLDVVGYSRRKVSAEPLLAAGGRSADSIAAAVDGAGAVITMLPDSPDVEAVALGADGVVETRRRDAIHRHVLDPARCRAPGRGEARRRTRTALPGRPGQRRERGAIDGTLSIMIGGAPEDVTAATSMFEVLGSTIMHVGPAEQGRSSRPRTS